MERRRTLKILIDVSTFRYQLFAQLFGVRNLVRVPKSWTTGSQWITWRPNAWRAAGGNSLTVFSKQATGMLVCCFSVWKRWIPWNISDIEFWYNGNAICKNINGFSGYLQQDTYLSPKNSKHQKPLKKFTRFVSTSKVDQISIIDFHLSARRTCKARTRVAIQTQASPRVDQNHLQPWHPWWQSWSLPLPSVQVQSLDCGCWSRTACLWSFRSAAWHAPEQAPWTGEGASSSWQMWSASTAGCFLYL